MARKKSESSDSLHQWFKRNKGTGWVDCKTGKKCGRSGKKDSGRPYPYCRPTMAQCKSKGAKAAARRKSGPGRVRAK